MLFGLHETTEPLRVVAIFAGFKYGHVTVRYSPKRDLWAMPRHRMAPLGGLSVLPGPVLAGGESSEWATRITLIPRFQTPHEPSQPQSQNRTLRNASASDRKGPTPRKDERTGNSVVTNAIPRIVYRKCVTREPFPFKVGNSHKQMTLVPVSCCQDDKADYRYRYMYTLSSVEHFVSCHPDSRLHKCGRILYMYTDQ